MLGSAEFGRCDHGREVLSLLIQPPVPFAQLVDGGGELVDPLHALVQQQFQPTGVIPFVGQLAAQSNDLGAQSVILFEQQLEFGARRLAVARVHGAKD